MERCRAGDAPLIIAGDFNDWRNRACDLLAQRLGLIEVFASEPRRAPRAAFRPPCRCSASTASTCAASRSRVPQVHFGPPWSGISDHAALSARLSQPR